MLHWRSQHFRLVLLPNFLRSAILATKQGILRHSTGKQLLGLPIYSYWDSHIEISSGAQLIFEDSGFLKLGVDYSALHASMAKASLLLRDNSRCTIRGHVEFHRGCVLWALRHGQILIDDHSYFANGTKVICESSITIGRNCAVSWDVTILDTDFHHITYHGKSPQQSDPIVIGNNVWIGSHARILKGSRIGSGSVVAAGAVVSGEFPENSLIGGVPARIIRADVKWY
jgi:acetyltransferase-like isoleucine patch superfamily enzyme